MKHRRRKAMRFEKLLWITKGAASRVGFLSNKYTPSRSRGLNACISSRITTVIHVARYHQINYNWFNEPFAVSQYNLFILRHAWLNLWDKHMTTGRINQVTMRHETKSQRLEAFVTRPSNPHLGSQIQSTLKYTIYFIFPPGLAPKFLIPPFSHISSALS